MKKNQDNQEVRVRFAPSPTGVLHVGGARTALFNFLYAKQCHGKIILRIEDTDKERSKKEYEHDILEGLEWLSLNYDELYRQSERTAIYKKYLEQLINTGAAYVSHESSTDEKVKQGEVIRFKNPNKEIIFNDIIRGDIAVNTTDLGDFVIAKDLETPLYNFAAVVDDHEMNTTHIIRGEDGISNTPRQILIQEAINAKRPFYAHLPFILAPDKSKLSKRHGAISVTEYRDLGFLPQALTNFLALIGWNPGSDQELFTIQDLIQIFSLEKVQKGGAVFNVEKLRWMNREYLKKMDEDQFRAEALRYLPATVRSLPGFNESKFFNILTIVKERLSTFKDLVLMADAGEFDYYFTPPDYLLEKLLWKDEKDIEKLKRHLTYIYENLQKIPESSFVALAIKTAIWDYATQEGRGSVLWPFRYALSGKEKSPDPFVLSQGLGKEETIRRIRVAIEKCSQ